MMLTAGVEAEVGNSALVGLPVGIDGGIPAIIPPAMPGPPAIWPEAARSTTTCNA